MLISSYGSNTANVERQLDQTAYSNVESVAGALADIATVTSELAAIKDAAAIATEPLKSNVGIVAGISSDVNTVASNSANVTAVASNNVNIDLVAGNGSNIDTVASMEANVGSVVGLTAGINYIEANQVKVAYSYDNRVALEAIHGELGAISWINANNVLLANVDANKVNIDNVAGSMPLVASVGSNMSSLITIDSNINDINTVATELAVGNKLDVVAADIVKVGTTAGAADYSNINNAYVNAASALADAQIASAKASAASTSEHQAQLVMWEAEAFKMTADSIANTQEDQPVVEYISDGNSGFIPHTITPTIYSAYHWKQKAYGAVGPVLLNTVETNRLKLVDIESGATADQTAGEIKSLFESNADTNVLVDSAKAKIDNITITQAVDLDTIEARVAALDSAVVIKGSWDASTGSFPVSLLAGESWIVSADGTVDGIEFVAGDRVIALVNTASIGIYTNEWIISDYTDKVSSVAGRIGNVVLTKVDVGLNNVDNTSDVDKVVSDATLLILDGKVDDSQVLTDVPVGALFTDTVYDDTVNSVHRSSTSNPHGVSKSQVGLSNVDNVSDANKPISVDQAAKNSIQDGLIAINTEKITYPSSASTKLAGIEAGATTDQTAGELLTSIKTVDGTGSGLDADLLQGESIANFITSYNTAKGI